MKDHIKIITILLCIGFVLAYILVAFALVEINPFRWTESGRVAMILIGITTALIFEIIYLNLYD